MISNNWTFFLDNETSNMHLLSRGYFSQQTFQLVTSKISNANCIMVIGSPKLKKY